MVKQSILDVGWWMLKFVSGISKLFKSSSWREISERKKKNGILT